MTVLDTQVLVWWTTAPQYIPKRVLKKIEQETKKDKILVSSISILEVYLLVKKGRIKFTIDVGVWRDAIEKIPYFQFVPVDNSIAANSVLLPGAFHKDPADRIITATAREYGATLITSDSKILKYPHVKTLW